MYIYIFFSKKQQIAKLLHNISVNKPFADDNQWLQPLNEYIAIAAKKFAIFFNKGNFI